MSALRCTSAEPEGSLRGDARSWKMLQYEKHPISMADGSHTSKRPLRTGSVHAAGRFNVSVSNSLPDSLSGGAQGNLEDVALLALAKIASYWSWPSLKPDRHSPHHGKAETSWYLPPHHYYPYANAVGQVVETHYPRSTHRSASLGTHTRCVVMSSGYSCCRESCHAIAES